MFRGGIALISAALLTAIAPIPKPSVAPEQQRPIQSIEQHQHGYRANERSQAPPPVRREKQQSAVTNDHTEKGEERPYDWGELFKTIIETISVAITAAFTVFLALWTRGLRDETKTLVTHGEKQLDRMAENIGHMSRFADAAAKQVSALTELADQTRIAGEKASRGSDKTVREMKESAQRELRAYVFYEPTGTTFNLISGNIWECIVRHNCHNSGQTPAYDLITHGDIRRMKYPLPANFVVTSPQSDIRSRGSIGAGVKAPGQLKKIVDFNLSADERLYVVGVLEYLDTFRLPRKTYFCGAIINLSEMIDTHLKNGEIPKANFEWTAQHNNAT